MNIEQKMAYIRKCLEMGATVDVYFHNMDSREQAKETAVELSTLGGMKHKHKSFNNSTWYKLKSDDYTLGISVFYDEKEEEATA